MRADRGSGLLACGALGLHFLARSLLRNAFHPTAMAQSCPKFVLITLLALSSSPSIAGAQKIDQSLYSSLEWRMIGPFRAGRTIGATGVRGQPNVFYVGVNNGGVWKTTDAGRVWTPIFDDQPTGSIGDI
ncbi:MAG: WD40/YVTN/BNR-like repeat-containing protein, partial [Gemmatimonadaceae bacterium]